MSRTMPKQVQLENPIFIDLGSILKASGPPKTDPREEQIDAKRRSKLGIFLEACPSSAMGPPVGPVRKLSPGAQYVFLDIDKGVSD